MTENKYIIHLDVGVDQDEWDEVVDSLEEFRHGDNQFLVLPSHYDLYEV